MELSALYLLSTSAIHSGLHKAHGSFVVQLQHPLWEGPCFLLIPRSWELLSVSRSSRTGYTAAVLDNAELHLSCGVVRSWVGNP